MTWPFENDTSAVEKKLATRSMKADKRRSIFVIITIALAVCLMGTLCFVYSSEQLQTLEHIQGQYQAGCSGITYAEIEKLAETGRFEKWGYTADNGSIRYQDGVLNISFVDPELMDLMGYGEITGSYPQTEHELCVERAFLTYFGFSEEIGQTVTLNLGDGEKNYTITGILETENNSRIFTIWISESSISIDENPAPYELYFRFAKNQMTDVEQLRLDIEAFFEEMGIPADRTFYSSNYFGMVELYLGNDMEIYLLAVFIALICAIVIYKYLLYLGYGKTAGIWSLKGAWNDITAIKTYCKKRTALFYCRVTSGRVIDCCWYYMGYSTWLLVLV